MATSFFTHNEIVEVLSDVSPFNNFLLNFFGSEHVTDDENINFDKIDPDNRLAVFVNPRRPGEVVKARGYKVNSYKPGYIKDKELVDPKHVFTRRPGEPMSQPLSNAARYAATVIDIAIRQKERLYRRLELMAAEFLLAGKYNMTGADIDVEVDFARNTGNTITLGAGAMWKTANATVSPLADIDTWINLATQPIRYLIVGKKAWKQITKDPLFDKLVYVDIHTKGSVGLINGPQQKNMDGVIFRGIMPNTGIEVYTYTGTYTHPTTGTETQFVADDTVLLLPDTKFGWQCFGAIWDDAANYSGMPYFFKNWSEQDPGIPFVMLQSAPMLAHTKINSTIGVVTGADGT